jgi:opacity protein-like surface antigen
MKRRLAQACGLALIPLLLAALPRTAGAITVGFKFFGGYNTMSGGDVNEGLKGLVDLYKTELALLGAISHGDYKAFHGGLEAGGDLIFYFTPVVGIGFGASYLQVQSSSEIDFSHPLGSLTWKFKPQVTAIPIRAGLYFAVPMGTFINLSINAGAEYYLARIKTMSRMEGSSSWNQEDMSADSKGKIGFCGGIGLEIKIHPNLSLLLEGRGRYARVDGFEGKDTESSSSGPSYTTSGKLYYVKIDFGPPFGQFPVVRVADTPPPADPMYQDVRSARLDINGFSALAGIMFKF